MDAYFVRVYTMQDGRKVEPNSIYALYEQAEADLEHFYPHHTESKEQDPIADLSDVAYVSIEKRFSPVPIWLV